MRFLGSKFTQNALAAGASPRTPLGELKRFQGAARKRQEKGKEGERGRSKRRKGVLGKGKGEGMEGKRGTRKGEGGGKGKGGGVCVIGVGGIDAHGPPPKVE